MRHGDWRRLGVVLWTVSGGAALLPSTALAQTPQSGVILVERIDSLVRSVRDGGLVSGISVGVQIGEEVVLARGYGSERLGGDDTDARTVYAVGSITKQFTAALIMRLVEEGRIDLEAPITRYLVDLDTRGRVVTVRQLLNHTSGIRSYPSDDTPLESLDSDLTEAELLAIIEAEPFDFEPGTSWRYSNAGYLLLGMIASEVAGLTYPELLEQRVFDVAGLEDSGYCDASPRTAGRPGGHEVRYYGLMRADELSMTHVGAAGAACSTAVDLLRWRAALANGRVVSQESYARMIEPTVLDGRPFPYGFALRPQSRLEGRPAVWHGGGINGFSSTLDHYPEADVTIVVLSNTYGQHVRKIADVIARWTLGIPQPVRLDRSPPRETMRRYEGSFRDDGGDQTWTLRRVGGRLYAAIGDATPSRMRWQGGETFAPMYSDFALIDFDVDDGVVRGFTIDECVPTEQSRCRTRTFSRIQ